MGALGESAQPDKLYRNGVEIAELGDFDGPEIQSKLIETTAHNDDWATFVAGVSRMGEINLTINYAPSNASHKALRDAVVSKSVDVYRVHFAGGQEWVCSGRVVGFKPSSPVDDKRTADVTIQPVGVPIFNEP